jgi:regulator of sigma E protease
MQEASFSSIGIGVLGVAFLIGFAIFIHELGHFLAAKWNGVGVKKFAIGFGPVIWSFERGGTEYSIRWVPLGGFVSLKGMIDGMEDEPAPAAAGAGKAAPAGPGKPEEPLPPAAKEKVSLTEDLDALRDKPAHVRIFVFVAGVTMNFLTAVALMACLLWYGIPKYVDTPNTLAEVPDTSQWHKLGWRSGDRILEIKKKGLSALSSILPDTGTRVGEEILQPLGTWDQVESAVEEAFESYSDGAPGDAKGQAGLSTLTLRAVVERKDKRLLLPIPLALWRDAKESEVFKPPLDPYVAMAVPASPAHRARLVKANYTPGEEIRPFPTWETMQSCPIEPNDRIVEIADAPVSSWQEMTRLISRTTDPAILITVERGKEKHLLRLIVNLEKSDTNPRFSQLGILRGRPKTGERVRMSLSQAIISAPVRTYLFAEEVVKETIEFFRRSSAREIKRNLGGPAAIAMMAYQSSQQGLHEYLRLFIYISLVLGLLNVMPIPVLDGGYILITLVEAVIQRPIPQRVLIPILTTFMLMFFTLFGFLFYNDFMNWVVKQ